MTANVGTIDRFARLVLGFFLLAAPFVSGSALFDKAGLGLVAVIGGLILIATAAVKFCPIYRIFGLKTCRI